MNCIERIKMIKAMEYIVRKINNENIFDIWLRLGVADGDISHGDLSINANEDVDLDYYINDENFCEIMQLFLDILNDANKNGGLYVDGVVSKYIDD